MKWKTTIRKVLSLVSFIVSAGALTGRSFKTTTNTILTWAFWSSALHDFLLSWFVLQSKNNTALIAVTNFQVFLVSNFALWSLFSFLLISCLLVFLSLRFSFANNMLFELVVFLAEWRGKRGTPFTTPVSEAEVIWFCIILVCIFAALVPTSHTHYIQKYFLQRFVWL